MLKIVTLLLLISSSAFPAETASTPKTETIESQTTDPTLNNLLKIPKVAEKYQECKKYYDESKEYKVNYSECIWNGIKKNDSTFAVTALDEKSKTEVQDELKKSQKNSDGKTDLSLDSSNISSTYKGHPGYQKLYDIVGKRLRESLGYTEDKNNKDIVAVDHSNFSSLYKAEVSKGIVDALSNYCMKVDYRKKITNTACIDECTLTKAVVKKDNKCEDYCTYYSYSDDDEDSNSKLILEAINNGKTSVNYSASSDGTDASTSGKADTEIEVGACMFSVSAACNNKYSTQNTKATKLACITDEYLKSSRKNLVLNEKLSQVYKEQMVSKSTSLEIKNLKKEVFVDKEKAVTVTSSEVESAYKKSNEELAQTADKCAKNPNGAECANLLDTNLTEKKDSVTELGLRQFAQEQNLSKDLENKDTFTTYLKGEGFTDDQIKELFKDEKKMAELKNFILDKYKAKKDSIISEITDRVNKTTSDVNGTISKDDVSKFSDLSDELKSKTNNLKGMTRFNNIASAYLVVDEGNGNKRDPASTKTKTKSVSTSLQAEINDKKTDAASNEKLKQTYKDVIGNSGSGNADYNIFGTLQDILGL